MKYIYLSLILFFSISILSAQGKVNEALGVEVEFTKSTPYKGRYNFSKIEHVTEDAVVYMHGYNNLVKGEILTINDGTEIKTISAKERATRYEFASINDQKFFIQTYYTIGKNSLFNLNATNIDNEEKITIAEIPYTLENANTESPILPNHDIYLSKDHSKVLFVLLDVNKKSKETKLKAKVWDIQNNFSEVHDLEFPLPNIKESFIAQFNGLVSNEGDLYISISSKKGKEFCLISNKFETVTVPYKDTDPNLRFENLNLVLNKNRIYCLGYYRNSSSKVGRTLGSYSAVFSLNGTLESEDYRDFSPYIFTGNPEEKGPIKHKSPKSIKKMLGYGGTYSMDYVAVNSKDQIITVGQNGDAQILAICYDQKGKAIWQKRIEKRHFGFGAYNRFSYVAAIEKDQLLIMFNDSEDNGLNQAADRKEFAAKNSELSNLILVEIDLDGNEKRSILWSMDKKKGYTASPKAGLLKDKNGTYYLLLSEIGKKNIKFAKIKF
jgi:hypothetical protein